MAAYSTDLRERVVAACDEGSMSRSEVAETFGVSVSFITKLLARRRDTGSIAAKPHAGGFAPAPGGRVLRSLAALVKEQPDATLAEFRAGLAARAGVSVSVPVVCRALRALGLPREKSRRTPASGTRRGSAGCAGRSPAS
jgi:transposase